MKFNFHTHSDFCDGVGKLEEYAISAINKGFCCLGFSGHAPVPFENTFAIPQEKIQEYCQGVRMLREKYKEQIKIYLSLEIDYIPGIMYDFKDIKNAYNLDYIIGSVHLVKNSENNKLWFIDGGKPEKYDKELQEVFNGNIKTGVKAFYHQTIQMILEEQPDVVGHWDKIKMNNKNRYFTEDEPWIQQLEDEVLDALQQTHCICEVNTRGLYKNRHTDFYPSVKLLQKMKQRNIPVTISSDAHNPEEIDLYFDKAVKMLGEIGYKEVFVFDNCWIPVGLEKLSIK